MYKWIPQIISLFIPYAIWLWSLRDMWFTKLMAMADVQICYIYTQYFLSHIQRRVYPLWDPFHAWGRPDDFAPRMIGELNPFLYTIPLFEVLGANFEQAYAFYLVLYLFVGCIGFYLLAKELLQNKLAAYIAYLLLVFSSFGWNIFSDWLAVLVIIPVIWFFYFAIRFYHHKDAKAFLGAVFSLMIIHTTYLPFHFYLTLLISTGLVVIVANNNCRQFLSDLIGFFLKHPILSSVGISLLIISLIPGFMWMWDSSYGQYVIGWRGDSESNGMALHMINQGGMIRYWPWSQLWEYLNQMKVGSLYMPLVGVLILLAGSIIRLNKRIFVLLMLFLMLFLVSLADLTPIHGWAYEHIFFVKYFRNLHFYAWFCVIVLCLLAGEYVKHFINDSLGKKEYVWWGTAILIISGVFFITRPGGIWSTWAAFILSLIVWSFRYWWKHVPKWISVSLLFLAIIVQPLEIMLSLNTHYQTKKSPIVDYTKPKEILPQFQFKRSLKENDHKIWRRGFGAYTDTSGYTFVDFYGLPDTYRLKQLVPEKTLEPYTQDKFYIVNNTVAIEEKDYPLRMRFFFLAKPKYAVLFNKEKDKPDVDFDKKSVTEANEQNIQVMKFDLNTIHFLTNFSEPQFIVYNDSFHPDWELFIDGQNQPIHLANMAFKGFWVSEGAHDIVLTFRSGREQLMWVLFALFGLSFLGLIILWRP